MKRVAASFLILVLLSVSAQSQQSGMLTIRADELREKVTYLASKELKGRGDGSPELKLAADYIARSFQKNGVKPAGDNGTYFQNFQMFTSRLGAGNQLRSGNQEFRLGQEYLPHNFSAKGEVEGPLVFAGYGVVAPHLNFDELSGTSLRGKIVVVIDRHPRADDFDSPFNRVHPDDIGSIFVKARNVFEAGALGMIVIQNPQVANFSIADLSSTFLSDYPRKDAPMGDDTDSQNPRLPVVWISAAAARSLVPDLRELQRKIDSTLKPQSLDLGKRALLKVDVVRVPFATQNVVGLIEGSDSRLRREVIVVGAHYDHDGEFDGQIWPGADDNASGTAGVLELAEAFGSGSMTPARSILLCAFAGEEKGEVGSQHYADHPSIPIDRTIAMLQMDMIGRNEEHGANQVLRLERETASQNANAVNVIGTIFSPDLRQVMEKANSGIGLDLKFRYDDTPENLLRRSDQWAFLQKRIPALFIHTGEHPDYHRPSDTAEKINYPKMEKIVRWVYAAVTQLANSPMPPAYRIP